MSPFVILKRPFTVLILLLMLALVACGGDEAVETAVVEATTPPTETAVSPTNTPEPTATHTPEPTATNTPEPTATNTPEPTATNTPEPTATNTPEPTATNTPEPTATNTPEPTAVPPTAVPATAVPETNNDNEAAGDESSNDSGEANADEEEDETPETITLYYISNPSDILGTFPVQPFEPDNIRSNMNDMQAALYNMRGQLDGAKAGDANACASYVQSYNNILYGSAFYDEVPAGWQDIETIYVLSFVYSLDRTRPAYLSCVDSGGIDDFNYSLAYRTIEEALSVLNPAIDNAATR